MSLRSRWSIASGLALALAALAILLFFEIGETRTARAPVCPPEFPPAEEPPLQPVAANAGRFSLLDVARDISRHRGGERTRALAAPPLPGKTQFVRRLVLGSRARELKTMIEGSLEGVVATQFKSWCVATLLDADWTAVRRIRSPKAEASLGRRSTLLEAELQVLTEPRCDLETVKLANPASDDDPLGDRVLIRLWTVDGNYPQGEIDSAARNLRHVAGVVRAPLDAGFDALAAPRRGTLLLPGQADDSSAAGIFFPSDRYCVVDTASAPSFRVVVLRHELMHALTYQALPNETSRMVREGLAEYLQLCRPGDRGLEVPIARMADNLARLERWIDTLTDRGADLDGLKPARLAALRPREFYSLRTFSYLVAQAAMAYVGSEVIEAAFAEKSERPIVDAVQDIAWSDFLEFVRTNAMAGRDDRAIVVEDAQPGEGPARLRSSDAAQRFRAALESLDVKVDADAILDPERLFLTPEERLLEEDRLLRVVEALLRSAEENAGAPGKGPILLADLSSALRDPITPATRSRVYSLIFKENWAALRNGFSFLTAAARAFRAGGEGSGTLLAGLIAEPRPIESIAVDGSNELTASAVAPWLSSQGRDPLDVVIFVSGRDEPLRRRIRGERGGSPVGEAELRAELTESYRRALVAESFRIRNALVVDLSRGKGDALPLARGIARAVDFHGEVAYWDPETPPRAASLPSKNGDE